ncbi:MAG: hypothetical protein ACOYIQ_01145 [Christensenellales bacterium]|jgi:hypothetical protein
MENINNNESAITRTDGEEQAQAANQTQAGNPIPPQEPAHGKWVPINPEGLNFTISGQPDQPIQGPDGQIYCIGNSAPTLAPVNSGLNAIPRPSSIIQMPSIVQPISLVPYTTQNQPMLQYDPYSRPLPPQTPEGAPRYKKKPYRGLSLVLMIIALFSVIVPIFLNVCKGSALQSTGADVIKALLKLAGAGDFSSRYYDYLIAPMGDIMQYMAAQPKDALALLGLPVIFALILLFDIILIIKYLLKIAKGVSPRGFSVLSFGNILLGLSVIAILYGLSEGLNANTVVLTFLLGQSVVGFGAGIAASVVLNFILLVLPYGAKKYAHILDVPGTNRTYFFPPNN